MKGELRQLQQTDLDEIQRLQNAAAPARWKMSRELLDDSLFAASHEFGKNTLGHWEDSQLKGYLGWVKGDAGELFGSPVLCPDRVSAAKLIGELVKSAEALKSCWVRVSCFPEDEAKIWALQGHQFKPEFEFVEFEIKPSTPNAPKLPIGITECPLLGADPSLFQALNNLSFEGVDNTLPMDLDDAKECLTSPLRDARLSLLWKNSVGNYVAYAVVNTDGYLDAIGVHPEQQKLGYGALLYKRVLAFAAEKKLARIYTTVSSRNYGSLRLHAKLGIPEVERRTVYQRNL